MTIYWAGWVDPVSQIAGYNYSIVEMKYDKALKVLKVPAGRSIPWTPDDEFPYIVVDPLKPTIICALLNVSILYISTRLKYCTVLHALHHCR